jgi:uncharacterized protein (DUF2267 family)
MEATDLDRARAFVLAKQGLGAAPGPADVLGVVEATGGVYGTAPTCYLACAARLTGFRVEHLDAELYEHRSLVRLRCMRGSAYVEPAGALPAIFAATRDDRALARVVKAAGIEEAEYERLARAVEAALRDHERPATVAEIRELLGAEAPKALSHVVGLMGRQGRLARATVRGGWKSDVYAYALWEDWVGEPLSEADPVDARAQLARRYLAAYGPATADDLRWWAGWKAGETKAALAALGDELATVDLEGTEALVLATETDALADADPDAGRGTRLLPVWDSWFMGYRDRARQVSREDYPNVYDKAGNATSVVTVDGVAAGVWELAEADADAVAVRVALFADASEAWWSGVEDAAGRIATMLGASELRVERAERPGPLADGARNAFLAPIRLGP